MKLTHSFTEQNIEEHLVPILKSWEYSLMSVIDEYAKPPEEELHPGRPRNNIQALIEKGLWPTEEVIYAAKAATFYPDDALYACSPKTALSLVGLHPYEAKWLPLPKRKSIWAMEDDNLHFTPPLPVRNNAWKGKIMQDVYKFMHSPTTFSRRVLERPPARLKKPSLEELKPYKNPYTGRYLLPTLTTDDYLMISEMTGIPGHCFIRYSARHPYLTDLPSEFQYRTMSWRTALIMSQPYVSRLGKTPAEQVVKPPENPVVLIGGDIEPPTVGQAYESALYEFANALQLSA